MGRADTVQLKISPAARFFWMRPAQDGTLQPLPGMSAAGRLLFALFAAGPAHMQTQADILNELYRQGDFEKNFYGELFSAAVSAGLRPGQAPDADGCFILDLIRSLLDELCCMRQALSADMPPHLMPGALAMLQTLNMPCGGSREELLELLFSHDPFAHGRSFRFTPQGSFEKVSLPDIRRVENFCGFHGARRSFREHFQSFAGGNRMEPLLISSLPGHGKTQMTISHALAHPELTLILAAGEMLESPLAELISKLRMRPDRRFVLFFDDIVPDELDWYTFRTHVGGSFSLPDNILLAAASNYEFPPSILSRGRSIQFPTFDDVRCMEMVEEFLGTWGFRRPNSNLISLIAARYTEEFGQKRYTELSPRTLMRYLSLFENNPQKRKDMVQLSCSQMITKPDHQLFYEFNISLMRRMYGNEYIENLLKERLRSLS